MPSFELKPDWKGKETVFYKVVFQTSQQLPSTPLFVDTYENLLDCIDLNNNSGNTEDCTYEENDEKEAEDRAANEFVVYRRFSQFITLYDIFGLHMLYVICYILYLISYMLYLSVHLISYIDSFAFFDASKTFFSLFMGFHDFSTYKQRSN